MRYAVPVNAPEEVGALAEAGASELYCGYQDAWWIERYGDHDSASRRQGRANLATLDELARCVEQAQSFELPLWLAFNSRYTEPQLNHLVELCGHFEQLGGTGIILSDLGLLWRLRGTTSLRRCLSILAVAQNRATLDAYQSIGISRVVLPRFMNPSSAGTLLGSASGKPDIEAEVMAFFDKCPWVDGYCRHRHGVTYAPREVEGGEDGDSAPPLYTFDTTYRTHVCLGRACTYLEPYPCAACHLAAFEQIGVGIAKLGGRGRLLEERLRAVRFLRAAEALATDEERKKLYQQSFGRSCACYYGPHIQRRSAIEQIENPPEAAGTQVFGSQTDTASFQKDLVRLREGMGVKVEPSASITLLIPPLSDSELARLVACLPDLCAACGHELALFANDLGTLITLARVGRETKLPFRLAMGTLLARMDDPSEVTHFLSERANPSKPVWGPHGEPRVLTYRRPPEPLVTHWQSPSLLEPSAQAALRFLLA